MTRNDIDHYRGLDLWGPVSAEDIRPLIEPLSLRRQLRALDVGCGQGMMLSELVERYDAEITGVDRSAAALALARANLARRAPGARATWIESEMNDLSFEEEAYDLILALGGPYRHDSLHETLTLYARWLGDDGVLLHGDGFWMQPPPAAYLEAIGLPRDALFSREAFLDVARDCGLESSAHWISTREAWDHFEDTVLRNHEVHAARHVGDPEVEAMIVRKRTWNNAQQRWGRDTMGFSVDVFRAGP